MEIRRVSQGWALREGALVTQGHPKLGTKYRRNQFPHIWLILKIRSAT